MPRTTRTKDKRDGCKASETTVLLTKETYVNSQAYGIKAGRDTQLKVMTVITNLITQEIVENPKGFKLPHRLGIFRIFGIPQYETRKKFSYSFITDGYLYRPFHWTPAAHTVIYAHQFSFRPSTELVKLMCDRIKSEDYPNWHKLMTVHRLPNNY